MYLELLQNYSPPDKPAIRSKSYPPKRMLVLRCYHGDGWAVCKFAENGSLQSAFNSVAAVVPLSIRGLPYAKGGPAWMVLPRFNGDPLEEFGYVGAKWREPMTGGRKQLLNQEQTCEKN